jgi:hypothetical protein
VKYESNCSIYSNKAIGHDIKVGSPSEVYLDKADSIFEEEEEDYFKRNSEVNIALKMLNEAGSRNYWP